MVGRRPRAQAVIASPHRYDVPMPQQVLLAEPRGFCAGVEMAIKALTWMVRIFEHEGDTELEGPIVVAMLLDVMA